MTIPDNQALEAAAGWVAILKRGGLRIRDKRALKAWLAADIVHAAALDLMMTCWNQVGLPEVGRPVMKFDGLRRVEHRAMGS